MNQLPNFDEIALEIRKQYDGRDPNLTKDPPCCVCYENPGTETCSRCKLQPYCSVKCQKAGLSEHRDDCKELAKLMSKMEAEAKALTAGQFGFSFGPPENAFEKHVGHFWGMTETRDYMRARLAVVEQLEMMNWNLETKRGWKMVLGHMQDMLRLCGSDNLGLRYRFPFVLINLNRDDDAYCFIRYWMEDSDSVYESRERMHQESKEGDWLYPKEDGARYKDILEERPDKKHKHKYTSLAFLVACAVIKMRVVAALDAKRLRGDSDFSKEQFDRQMKMLTRLLDVIDANNKSMLPALVNPGPLREAGDPGWTSPGHPSEALSVLNDACRPWVRIPGAEELLAKRVGTRATNYNTNTHMAL